MKSIILVLVGVALHTIIKCLIFAIKNKKYVLQESLFFLFTVALFVALYRSFDDDIN